MCLMTPLSSPGRPNGPTERAQIKSFFMEIGITVDGGGQRWRVACTKGYRSYWFGWRSPRFWMDSNTILYKRTERTAMNSLVPFFPVPQRRMGLRHALRTPLKIKRPERESCDLIPSFWFLRFDLKKGWACLRSPILPIRRDKMLFENPSSAFGPKSDDSTHRIIKSRKSIVL